MCRDRIWISVIYLSESFYSRQDHVAGFSESTYSENTLEEVHTLPWLVGSVDLGRNITTETVLVSWPIKPNVKGARENIVPCNKC